MPGIESATVFAADIALTMAEVLILVITYSLVRGNRQTTEAHHESAGVTAILSFFLAVALMDSLVAYSGFGHHGIGHIAQGLLIGGNSTAGALALLTLLGKFVKI